MIIRTEQKNDYDNIKKVVYEAFKNAEHTDGNEHNLVDKLRSSKGFIEELTLVAIENDEIIGHILFTEVKVSGHRGIALAPLSVSPNHQRKGVGTALMNEAHLRAKKLGYPFSIVLGSNDYYPKAGYKTAYDHGILAPFEVPKEFFMVLLLDENFLATGTVEYVKEMLEG